MARLPLATLVPVVAIGVIVMFTFGMSRQDPDALPSALIGQPAPPLETTPLDVLPQVLDSDLRSGGVKLVNFWASWCAPCRAEHPNLEKLSQMGVAIYGVNYKDEPEKALKFLSDLGNPYTAIGQDVSGRQAIYWGVYGVPETYVLDNTGKILLRFPGPITARVLTDTILPAIAEAQSQ
jgi:cytochrome c biogenesis protein CcmG/thiol:disulfide interchange protein DsbE